MDPREVDELAAMLQEGQGGGAAGAAAAFSALFAKLDTLAASRPDAYHQLMGMGAAEFGLPPEAAERAAAVATGAHAAPPALRLRAALARAEGGVLVPNAPRRAEVQVFREGGVPLGAPALLGTAAAPARAQRRQPRAELRERWPPRTVEQPAAALDAAVGALFERELQFGAECSGDAIDAAAADGREQRRMACDVAAWVERRYGVRLDSDTLELQVPGREAPTHTGLVGTAAGALPPEVAAAVRGTAAELLPASLLQRLAACADSSASFDAPGVCDEAAPCPAQARAALPQQAAVRRPAIVEVEGLSAVGRPCAADEPVDAAAGPRVTVGTRTSRGRQRVRVVVSDVHGTGSADDWVLEADGDQTLLLSSCSDGWRLVIDLPAAVDTAAMSARLHPSRHTLTVSASVQRGSMKCSGASHRVTLPTLGP